MSVVLRPLRALANLGLDDSDLSPSDAKHVQVTNLLSVPLALAMAWWVPVSLQAGATLNAAENLGATALFLVVPLLNRARWHRTAALLVVGLAHVQLAWAMYWFGEPSGTRFFYGGLILGGYAALPRSLRYVAHLSAAVVVLEMALITRFEAALPLRLELMPVRQQEIANTAIGTAILALVGGALISAIERAEAALDDARRRADALLLNVLPPSIADRLKEEPGEPIADRYDDVTVLFADLVGFTPLSERLSAERTVEILNQVFTAFDAMCERAGVEKIRTIGDGYMAVCGAPNPRSDHAEVLTRVAIEMRDYMATQPTGEPLQVRIGLNSGEAVAAIVGTSRFHFDLWGDAVNVAARMESLGEPGRIHIARGTWEHIHTSIPCVTRGAIEVKGKGQMETWFVA